MNVSKVLKGAMIALTGVVLAVGIFSTAVAHADTVSSTTLNVASNTAASAPTSTQNPCVLSAADFQNALQNGTISYSNIAVTSSTASVTVTNNTGCSAPVNLSSYEAFVPESDPHWLSTQQFINSASSSIAASSTQTLTVPVASCKTQVDAWYGGAPTTLLDSNPYVYPSVPFVFTWDVTSNNVCVSAPTTPSADLSITKTVDNANPSEGSIVNYTVTVFANGPATSTGVMVQDALPAGLTFVSATSSEGSYASSSGVWTIGDMSASSSATLVISASVNAGTAGETITNMAVVSESAGSIDPNLANNTASVCITVAPVSMPSPCTLSASDFTNALHNGTISFTPIAITSSTATITVTNKTNCGANLWFGSNEMFVPIGGPNWLTSQVPFDRATSTLAASSTVTMTVNLPSCMAQIDAWQDINSSNPFSYAFTALPLCSATSTPSADLSITKTIDNATPSVGDTVNYTLTVAALGPATSTGVVATDTLPSGLTFENATASVGTYASSTGTWTIGDMGASSTANLEIAALVNSGEDGQTITNTAIVGESASSTDNNLSNNSSSVSITVQSNGCTSNCGGGGGTPATSTITVNVSGLVASDTAQLAVQDLTASTTQSTSTGNGSSAFVLATNDNYAVTATTTNPNYTEATSSGCAGTLAADATCNITFTLASTTPATDAGIEILKTVDNANPVGGATVNYTITVTTTGPATSTIVSAQDILPMGLSLISATTSVGNYDMSSGDWTIGTLSPNATATLLIAATVSPNYDGQTITNTATVSELSSLVNPDSANTSSSVSINVQPAACTSNCGGGGGTTGGGGGGISTAEIGITKTVDNATPNPGATINYTLTVQAIGPNASLDVVASDTLPAGVTFVSASSSAGTYNSNTGTWTLGTVNVGTNPTLVITATVNSSDTIGQVITNTATIGESINENDPLTGNNTASATITVGGSNGGGGGSGGGSTTVGGGGGGGSTGVSSGGSTGGSTGEGQVLGASASCGIYLDQYIHPIRKYLNDPTEVEKLQTFLNQNLGINLPITGYYGPETIAAVDQFQVKYHIEVLQPWLAYGLPTEYTPTQYVYKTTQRWINLIMCSSLNLPIPQLP